MEVGEIGLGEIEKCEIGQHLQYQLNLTDSNSAFAIALKKIKK